MILDNLKQEIGAVNAGAIEQEFSDLEPWETWRKGFKDYYDTYSLPDMVGLIDASDVQSWRNQLTQWEGLMANEGIIIPPYVVSPDSPETPETPEAPEPSPGPQPSPFPPDYETSETTSDDKPFPYLVAGVGIALALGAYYLFSDDS